MQISMNELDWTFLDDDTREYTHIYHDYPARMIPQIPRQVMSILNEKSGNMLFDPYCGSGSSLVEGLLKGLSVIGTDINPLARLISEAKTTYSVNPHDLEKELNKFVEFTLRPDGTPKLIQKENLDFWFKKASIRGIGLILRYVDRIVDPRIRDFFRVAASETIRESSNTRKSEFKLYRYPDDKLAKHNPDPFTIMKSKLFRNLKGYEAFHKAMKEVKNNPNSSIYSFNTVKGIPKNRILTNSIDIVITSPPYGDSHTTVAYGQYSRLSSEWLGILKQNVDSMSMGGMIAKSVETFNCASLDTAIKEIAEKNDKRAREVSSFYLELEKSIKNVSKVVKTSGFSCYVVANRKVAGISLPTNKAIECFFEKYGFSHFETFQRTIPNKRMPSKNSPSNVPGKTEDTMSREYIVVMQKEAQKQ